MSGERQGEIQKTSLRRTVQIQLENGEVLEGPRGSQLESFMRAVENPPAPIVGGVVNGSLRELTFCIEMDSTVRPITMGEADGMRIYRRSLTFLLAAAFEELFPDTLLTVDHSISSGGYFCHVSGRAPLTETELGKLEARMRDLTQRDLPFSKVQMPLETARRFFEEKGYEDKVRLLRHRRKPYLIIYQLDGFRDYHHGYMLPSTGYLKWFALAKTEDGFTLRFPRRHRPTELLPLPENPTLLATFRQYGDWLKTLGISDIGALNDAVEEGRAREIILVSEALHERHIAAISAQIAERAEQVRVVLVAGPSASGKTTFSKRLSIQLLATGLSPFPLEMDNFFVDRAETPKDETGEYDYESLEALDLDRLNHDMERLIRGERVQLPRYDFLSGKQTPGETVQLAPGQIIILEGIHGLNPALLRGIPTDATFRIYVSALTQLNLDRYNRVSTTDTRLIRRIVRDASHRGYSASDTIERWESVRRGEKRHIFPYQGNADAMFNSALLYEGASIAPIAEPLIRQVSYGTPEWIEAKRLLAFLGWFRAVDTNFIPDNSILREFVGDSILDRFTPWQFPRKTPVHL
jgi:uridine kinase